MGANRFRIPEVVLGAGLATAVWAIVQVFASAGAAHGGTMHTVEWFKSLYENGIFAFMQAVLVVAGLVFAGFQLRQARRSFQATVVSQISDQSSQLQREVMKDPELQPLLGFPRTTEESAKVAERKRQLTSAQILNHFARIYDLWKLGGMPNEIWDTFQTDLGTLVSRPEFNHRWPRMKRWHRPGFVALVDWLISEAEQRRREEERTAS
jgi:hypothetical protein